MVLDLCELDLFEQESGNETNVSSGPSEHIQVRNITYILDIYYARYQKECVVWIVFSTFRLIGKTCISKNIYI